MELEVHELLVGLVIILAGWIAYKRFKLFSKMAPGNFYCIKIILS